MRVKVSAHATNDAAVWRAAEAGVDAIDHGYQVADSTLALMARKGTYLVPTDVDTALLRGYLRRSAPGTPEPSAERLAQIVAADSHPLIVPRIRTYLEKELHVDEAGRTRWAQHWILEALNAIEAHLVGEPGTGRFCHGDTPTLADICLATQVFGTQFFDCDTSGVPAVMRVFGECMKIEAFDRAQPLKQPGAPKELKH